MSPGRVKSVEFVANQYDQFVAFKEPPVTQIKQLIARVNEISVMRGRLVKATETFEAYSYQLNIKVVGLPLVAERETPEQTASLYFKLFYFLHQGWTTYRLPTSTRFTVCHPVRLRPALMPLCANLFEDLRKKR